MYGRGEKNGPSYKSTSARSMDSMGDGCAEEGSLASLWKMKPQRLIFALKSMCDQMPTAVNLAKWKLAESVECTKCGRRET